MERIKRHLLVLPLTEPQKKELRETLEQAYSIRNRVVHEADSTAATTLNVTQLMDAVQQLLRFALR